MFTVYYSNQLKNHIALLLHILDVQPNTDPFQPETILVQSAGMAQWLQMEIAQEKGISANLAFPFPTSFLWQQYRNLLPNLPKENIFSPNTTIWKLMQLIPQFLEQEPFNVLRLYLGQPIEQYKLYQLAKAVADLFDQYLVYRPHWLINWEKNQDDTFVNDGVFNEIKQQLPNLSKDLESHIQTEIQWQSQLWNALVQQLKQESSDIVFQTSHRAYFQQQFFEKLENLTQSEKQKLPKRVFIFGISSLPTSQLDTLKKLSQHCDIHLFFLNPSQHYWGNELEQKVIDKIALHNKNIAIKNDKNLSTANPLLTTWGKQGRDFLNSLIDFQENEVSAYINPLETKKHLLAQIQQSILDLSDQFEFTVQENDHSFQIHSCHSPLREVEVLHNQLLSLFEQHPDLCPKDIIVMSPNIDLYAPYIKAVFERKDPCAIPYSLSDQQVQNIDPIINSFISLLTMNESQFSVEDIFDLLDISTIQKRYHFSATQIDQIRYWVVQSGIRSGLNLAAPLENSQWKNYNSWENGLNRLLLGTALKEENGVWQETVAFDESYGLNAEISGQLSQFICNISDWINFIKNTHSIEQWQNRLIQLLEDFYVEDETSSQSLLQLYNAITKIAENITACHFKEHIGSEIIVSLFNDYLDDNKTQLNFLAGRVNFATLLPMRAIPFKVVCLLGMNEKDFPRQYNKNSFNLMNYAPQKGDRAKREDDRYLFLEALLSAQEIFYISYIGQSLTKNHTELPSVLVSQLCDYLSDNQLPDFFKENVIKHSMTAFSYKNFMANNPHQSYAKYWLETLNAQQVNKDFLTTIDNKTEVSQLNADDLISFLQHPIKFFFNHHLGIKFTQKTDNIKASEPFDISGLDKYVLNDQLLITKQQNFDDFFAKEKYKGNLPINAFGKIKKTQLIDELTPLHCEVSSYLAQPLKHLDLEYKSNDLTLNANLHFYSQSNQVMIYRAGKLRDKDIIKIWLYHLLLQIQHPEITIMLVFKASDKNKDVGKLMFNTIEKTLAINLIEQYIHDYLKSFSQLEWGIYQQFDSFFKETKKNTVAEEIIPKYLEKLIIEDRESHYLQRIINQTSGLNSQKIYQKTYDWFEMMWNNKIIQ